jgi:uncharacterized membrane protein
MLEYITTFFAVFFTDLIYVYFVKSIQNNRPWNAAWWSMVVTFTASVAIINYTTDHWALVPALLGAYCGTLFGMKIKERVDNLKELTNNF